MTDNNDTEETTESKKPNILFIMVDQMQYPHYEDGGFNKGIRDILGFKPIDKPTVEGTNPSIYTDNYPGFMALRNNGVVLRNHRIATSACVPSRTAIFTGQYGTQTHSTQTDGIFKSGTDKNFPWLNPHDMPTIGSYMRAAGYNSFYMGKWHISGEGTSNLDAYGFSDWELSYPDPHGYLPNNLGFYRDYQFRDLTTSFLRRQGLGEPYNIAHAQHNAGITVKPPSETPTPWFAVSSFANPHDIASYPGLPSLVSGDSFEGKPYILKVPTKNKESNLAESGTMKLKLNQSGLKQKNSTIAPSWQEKILSNNKPDCQFDYSYKMGLSLMASPSLSKALASVHKAEPVSGDSTPDIDAKKREALLQKAIDISLDADTNGVPLAMTTEKEEATTAFMQYYAYLISEVDQHIKAVLDALEESGQADNTIVIFCPDHGEYAGAHNMMTEKWSTGYDEILHVPMIVRFPKDYDVKSDIEGYDLRQIDTPTSHIDILPTILGLAGVDIDRTFNRLERSKEYNKLLHPVGTDLSALIKDGTAVAGREGVLFINYDTITEPLYPKKADTLPSNKSKPLEELDKKLHEDDITPYEVYLGAVKQLIASAGDPGYPEEVANLEEGSVRQPCYVHCVVDNEGWKLVRYFDLYNKDEPEQYELYNLNNDNTEQNNLVVYDDFPRICSENPANGTPDSDIAKKTIALKVLMEKLEKELLHPKKARPL